MKPTAQPAAAATATAPAAASPNPEDFAPFAEVQLRDLAAALYEAPLKRRAEVFAAHEIGPALLEAVGDAEAAAHMLLSVWGGDITLADAA